MAPNVGPKYWKKLRYWLKKHLTNYTVRCGNYKLVLKVSFFAYTPDKMEGPVTLA